MDSKLTEYFERPDTPMANSPVGKVMIQLVEKRPGITFDECYEEAKRLLAVAAGRKRYLAPHVLTVEQEAEAKRKHQEWLKTLQNVA